MQRSCDGMPSVGPRFAACRSKLDGLTSLARMACAEVESLDALLQGFVNLIPGALRSSGVCSARVTLDGKTFATDHFGESPRIWAANIRVHEATVGHFEVHYFAMFDYDDESCHGGPFCAGDALLCDAIAGLIGSMVQREWAERRVRKEQDALREASLALTVALQEIEDGRQEVEEAVVANVESNVMPLLDKLDSHASARQREQIDLLRKNLQEIISPFIDELARACDRLTPVEIQICERIRRGHTTKEIARMRNVSVATVSKQRERIRKKLGIAGTEVSLGDCLSRFSVERLASSGQNRERCHTQRSRTA